ncbi:MAG: threonine/homoserine/homoserine lactone efflux protein [Parvicellaceae bacterium]
MNFELVKSSVLLGLILSVLIGPVFFVLLETSIRRGARDAILIDIGVLLADVLYLFVAYFSAEQITIWIEKYEFLKYIGAGVIIIYGIYTIVKKKSPQIAKNIDIKELKRPNPIGLISKGMGLNAMNPAVLAYWLFVCTYQVKGQNIEGVNVVIFFSICLGTMFIIDIVKIYFASKLKEKLTPKNLATISIIVGCILILIGILMCFKDIQLPDAV